MALRALVPYASDDEADEAVPTVHTTNFRLDLTPVRRAAGVGVRTPSPSRASTAGRPLSPHLKNVHIQRRAGSPLLEQRRARSPGTLATRSSSPRSTPRSASAERARPSPSKPAPMTPRSKKGSRSMHSELRASTVVVRKMASRLETVLAILDSAVKDVHAAGARARRHLQCNPRMVEAANTAPPTPAGGNRRPEGALSPVVLALTKMVETASKGEADLLEVRREIEAQL